MPEGNYELLINLEGGEYNIQCAILAEARNSFCSGLSGAKPSGRIFELSVNIDSLQLSETWDEMAPALGFTIVAWGRGEAEDPDGKGVFVPKNVSVVLNFNNITIADGQFEPKIERDDAFYGDERCGFCETTDDLNVVMNLPGSPS